LDSNFIPRHPFLSEQAILSLIPCENNIFARPFASLMSRDWFRASKYYLEKLLAVRKSKLQTPAAIPPNCCTLV